MGQITRMEINELGYVCILVPYGCAKILKCSPVAKIFRNKKEVFLVTCIHTDLSLLVLRGTIFTRLEPCCFIQSEIRMLTSLWSRNQPTFSPLCISWTATSPNSLFMYSTSSSTSEGERPFLSSHFNTSYWNVGHFSLALKRGIGGAKSTQHHRRGGACLLHNQWQI